MSNVPWRSPTRTDSLFPIDGRHPTIILCVRGQTLDHPLGWPDHLLAGTRPMFWWTQLLTRYVLSDAAGAICRGGLNCSAQCDFRVVVGRLFTVDAACPANDIGVRRTPVIGFRLIGAMTWLGTH